MDNLLQTRISLLYLSSDILEYPTKSYTKTVEEFYSLIDSAYSQFESSFIESEYIRLFSMKSSSLKTVPFASWWLDGKMCGQTLSKVEKFYETCGFDIDRDFVKKPLDHISIMITFIAILLKEKRFEEIKKFAKFLTWLNDFANSLDSTTQIEYFKDAVNVTNNIINSLKEEI